MPQKIAGAIIAGGRSTRMGTDKLLAQIGAARVIDRIADRLRPQVATLIINANEPIADVGLELVPDRLRNIGTPVAGLHAVLHWARENGFEWIVTVTGDAPFLLPDLVSRLSSVGGAAIAASGGQSHYLTGMWPTGFDEPVTPGMRAQDWAKRACAQTVEWPTTPYDPFFNINTPEDLAEARRIAEEFHL